jgi:hypothetical protein
MQRKCRRRAGSEAKSLHHERVAEPDLDTAIDQAMAEAFLDEAYRGMVRDLLSRKDDVWRRCCGSNCFPCALTLARVVDRVRQLAHSGKRRAGGSSR